jgi:hypothetical protein
MKGIWSRSASSYGSISEGEVMANITVKEVPDGVHQELKEAARSQGRSLNAYIISLLKADVQERWRRRHLSDRWENFERFLATLPPTSDSTPLIREDRERGH